MSCISRVSRIKPLVTAPLTPLTESARASKPPRDAEMMSAPSNVSRFRQRRARRNAETYARA